MPASALPPPAPPDRQAAIALLLEDAIETPEQRDCILDVLAQAVLDEAWVADPALRALGLAAGRELARAQLLWPGGTYVAQEILDRAGRRAAPQRLQRLLAGLAEGLGWAPGDGDAAA